jgi:hypothetical protein
VNLSRYVIEIGDPDWNMDGQLRAWDNLTCITRAFEIGSGAVDCSSTPHNRAIVGAGAGRTVRVKRDGKVIHAGVLRIAGESTDGAVTTLKLSWDDTMVYLANEPAFPNPGTPTGQGPSTHDSRIGYTSTVVRGFVDANVGPSARPERRAPAFTVGGDPLAGEYLQAPVVARWDNLLELIRGVAMPNGLVYEIETSDRGHTFNVRQARYLGSLVPFSQKLHNISNGEYSLSAPEATRVLVLGPYEGTARITFMVPDASESVASEQRWRRRVVHVIDSSSIVKADEGIYATQVAAREAAEAAEDAAEEYADYTADLATKAERKAADWAEDEDRPQSEKDQATREATAARATAGEAAANHVILVAARVAAEAVEAEAIERADRDNTIQSLYAEAYRVLEEKGETVEAQYEILDGTFEFGVDYKIGDIVRVQPGGFAEAVDKPVREVAESVSVSAGRKVTVVVGDYGVVSNSTSKTFQMRALIATVRRLQTR